MTKLKWNSAGERLFEAGVDRGVLYTKDVGAPPAPVAVGAPSATKPMLLPLRQWGVDQALWLPGQAGNYASIPDVNLLDANTAHGQQGIGKWSAPAPTIQTPPTSPAFGTKAIRFDPSIDGDVFILTASGISGIPVASATQYTLSLDAYFTVTRSAELYVAEYNSSGGLVKTTQVGVSDSIGAAWFRMSETFTTAATTVFIRPTIFIQSGLASDFYYISSVCLRTGSDPTFVPSTRIVGNVDLRAFLATNEQIPAAGNHPMFITKDDGASQRSYGLRISAVTGLLGMSWSEDGSALILVNSTIAPIFTGNLLLGRATLDVDNGAGGYDVTFYTKPTTPATAAADIASDTGWVQLGATVTGGATTSIFPGDKPVVLGNRFDDIPTLALQAAYLAFEIRDDIYGPIVASADFTNPAEVDGDSWTTPEGHTGTINRSGDATAELLDRNCWAFTGAEYLSGPSLGYRIGTYPVSVLAGVMQRSNVATNGYLVSMRDSLSPNLGMSLQTFTTNVYLTFDNGPSQDQTSKAKATAGTWFSVLGYRNGQNVLVEVNDSAGPSVVDNALDVSTEQSLTIGVIEAGAGNLLKAQLSHVVIIIRQLTTTERTQLASWDGSVANEPKWLRDDPDLVLYLNADADETVEAYEDDVVVSLHGLKPWYPDFHGIPWNGLVAVNERTVGGEVTPYYIDGIKYLDEASNEDFEATIEAFTYPEEFMQYEGYKEVHNGLFVTHQQKRSFGLSYRTLVGNDLEGQDHAYKIHIIYNAMVIPTERDNNTIGDDIDPQNFSWDIVTKPPDFTGYKQTAHFIIDSREIPTQLLKDLEDILYGTETTDPRLPLVTELIELFETGSVEELYDIWDAGELGETVDATIDGGEL